MAEGAGHGKLILCGEHAVVYGHPAIALAVDRGTHVTLRPGPHQVPDDPRLLAALKAVVPEGLGAVITTDLPIGRGMGSSAALAIALVRAVAQAEGVTLTAEQEYERGFVLERIFHGTPSGIDHTVAARGGVLRYRRRPEGPELHALPAPTWQIAVLDSGSAGDTGVLVAGVASRRPGVDPVLEAIGALVGEVEQVLPDASAVGPLLSRNHELLQAIGVSTPVLDELVQLALDAGAYGAKLAGAGGGGVVIALAPDPEAVVSAAAERGIRGFLCRAWVP